MNHGLDQIRKLLNTANAHPESNEGKSARKIAERKLKKLGLSEQDVSLEARKLLDKRRHAWEGALLDVVTGAYPCELRQLIDTNKESDDLLVHACSTVADQVEYRFNTLRRHLLRRSGDYHRSIRLLVTPREINALVTVFLNYAVIALSERLLTEDDDDDDDELEQLEDQEEKSLEGEDGPPEGEEAEDLLDKLIKETQIEVPHDLPRILDPALAGYQVGHEVPLTDALTQKAVEEAKQLVSRAGFITEDQTRELEEDFEKWEDLF